MRLADIYATCVELGMAADARDRRELERVLAENLHAYEKLDDKDKAFFDTEKLTNPYADTRICVGEPDTEIMGLLVGIDMEVGEVLLADRLREQGHRIDLIFAHHPEGPGYASLHEVMPMQADLWALQGVGLGVASNLIEARAQELRRKVMPVNHYRAIDAARLLGFASLSCHTPADNSVNEFVQRHLDESAPGSLGEVVRSLRSIPEYADAARKGYGPAVVLGESSSRPGKMLADMTGGTEGPKEALDRLATAGVDTLVGMHYSEEYRKHAQRLKMNLVVAGHISSDTLGMNLILDAIERLGPIEVLCCSGMVRYKR